MGPFQIATASARIKPSERLMGMAEVSTNDHLEGGMAGVGNSGGEELRRLACRDALFMEEGTGAEDAEAVANPICFSDRR